MPDRATIDSLFPSDLPEPSQLEEQYPPRDLPAGAKVTRIAPSPTGYIHVGGLYAGMIDKDVSAESGGVYILRIEDTDQAREVEGAVEQFERAFAVFGVSPDEYEGHGAYGPYFQSARSAIYMSYVRELLRQDKAYLCFATKDDLAAITAQQNAAKIPTGYYGKWAIWREAADADVLAKLAEGAPYVVRFRSPGAVGARVAYDDAIRGRIEADDNRNDVVILKTSAVEPRLPTYHLAHAVDDHLMRVNMVIRADEWISSVPLHLQLFDALGFERPTYAHIAPLQKQDKGGKRKLSKRKDPEASVDYYVQAGYPIPAVQYYLRGLANGKLAEVPLEEALATRLRIEDCGVAGPLVDLVKLEDISADYVASTPGPDVLEAVFQWSLLYDKELAEVIEADRVFALKALAVERDGVENPRKDLRKWSDFRQAYGFFFPGLFALVSDAADERFTALGLSPDMVRTLATDFADSYQQLEDPQEWFEQIRSLAARHGFAKNAKEFKKNPSEYPGSIREASQVIRILLTGSTRSPDLHAVTQAIGSDEVLRRIRAVL